MTCHCSPAGIDNAKDLYCCHCEPNDDSTSCWCRCAEKVHCWFDRSNPFTRCRWCGIAIEQDEWERLNSVVPPDNKPTRKLFKI